jgi:hypothetical protein
MVSVETGASSPQHVEAEATPPRPPRPPPAHLRRNVDRGEVAARSCVIGETLAGREGSTARVIGRWCSNGGREPSSFDDVTNQCEPDAPRRLGQAPGGLTPGDGSFVRVFAQRGKDPIRGPCVGLDPARPRHDPHLSRAASHPHATRRRPPPPRRRPHGDRPGAPWGLCCAHQYPRRPQRGPRPRGELRQGLGGCHRAAGAGMSCPTWRRPRSPARFSNRYVVATATHERRMTEIYRVNRQEEPPALEPVPMLPLITSVTQ